MDQEGVYGLLWCIVSSSQAQSIKPTFTFSVLVDSPQKHPISSPERSYPVSARRSLNASLTAAGGTPRPALTGSPLKQSDRLSPCALAALTPADNKLNKSPKVSSTRNNACCIQLMRKKNVVHVKQ